MPQSIEEFLWKTPVIAAANRDHQEHLKNRQAKGFYALRTCEYCQYEAGIEIARNLWGWSERKKENLPCDAVLSAAVGRAKELLSAIDEIPGGLQWQ